MESADDGVNLFMRELVQGLFSHWDNPVMTTTTK